MNEDPLDLRRFARTIAHGKWIVVACVLAAVIGAAVFTFARPPRRQASAVVLLPHTPTTSGQSRDIQTEVEVGTSAVVLQLASQSLPHHPRISALQKDVTVSAPTSDVLVFKGHATSARRAVALANAAANAYATYVKNSANDQAQRVTEPLNDRIRSLLATSDELQGNIDRALASQNRLNPSSSEYANLSSQIAQWQSQLQAGNDELQSYRNQIATAEATNVASSAVNVISPAVSASNKIAETVAVNLLVALLVGLLAGITIVIARDSRKRALRFRPDLAAAAGVPTVASLAARTARNPSEWLVLLDDYEPSADEQWGLRKLLRIILAGNGEAPATATVLSLASDETALAVAPQLAAFAAGAGVRTALVLGGADRSVPALRQVRDVAAISGMAPRENLSLVEEMPTEKAGDAPGVDLVVRMVVGDTSDLNADRAREGTILLAISPGAATPEEIQTVADAAADASAPLAGIVVANPKPHDASQPAVPDAASAKTAKRWSAS